MKLADVNNELTYNYTPFYGEYNKLVEQIALGFDVVAGDVTILEERYEYVDFSTPCTESGMVLIVPIRSTLPNGMWLFLKPFTNEMWGVLVAITIYNGFAVWLIERKHNDEFRPGTVWNQIGILFLLAFSTLFMLRAGPPNKDENMKVGSNRKTVGGDTRGRSRKHVDDPTCSAGPPFKYEKMKL